MEIKIMSEEEAKTWSYNQWIEVAVLVSILETHS